MRTPPVSSPASTTRQPGWNCEARVVLITRLFGGGAKTREIDKVSWLRSSAAKSALRAWWRAAHAHEFPSLETLRKKEEELFGASGTFDAAGRRQGGPGALEVVTDSRMAVAPVSFHEALSNPLNYALFPAQGMGQPAAKVAPASDQTWAAIKLTSRSSDVAIHGLLLESLRLWLTLGGVGARTRRGVGAVAAANREEAQKLGLPETVKELEVFLRSHCRSQTVPKPLAEVFCLARTRRIFLGPLQATGEEAQKKLLSILRKARQDRPQPPQNQWGRSRWPEADAIRLKFDPQRQWHHSPESANAKQYPRAALGLPIVIHYKDSPPREPKEHHVLGALPGQPRWHKLERYSSPVLLRPVRVWEGDQVRYVPVALFTDCTLPADARPLVTEEPKAEPKSTDIVRSYEISSHADATLRRIEDAFDADPEFRIL
jgi:CRISPR-associated protein Cmr1